MTEQICSIDTARLAFPHLGLAVYAMDPTGPVTLEVHTPDGQMFSFIAASEQAAFLRAFPPDVIAEPPPTPPSETNIFD